MRQSPDGSLDRETPQQRNVIPGNVPLPELPGQVADEVEAFLTDMRGNYEEPDHTRIMFTPDAGYGQQEAVMRRMAELEVSIECAGVARDEAELTELGRLRQLKPQLDAFLAEYEAFKKEHKLL